MERSRNSFLLLSMAVLCFQHAAFSSADFPVGSQATVQLPPAPYQPGFTAEDVVLRAQGKSQPGFVAAVSVEAGEGGYTCALVVLLGDVKVWASDHLDKFVPTALCRLQLTGDGQLRLTDGARTVGWVSGTAGQGVKALRLNRRTGNLVLIDAQNCTRWESLDHPTDKFLRCEQRRLPLHFVVPTSKVISPAAFYSLELDGDKIAAYVNLGESKYSYWELAPSAANRTTMASARLDGSGLKMLDAQGTTVARIMPPVKKPPLSFLALETDGNLGMYYYEARHRKFKASYRALGFCELPLSCGVGEVCSAAGKCDDVSLYAADEPVRGGDAGSSSSSICNGGACMVHLRSVTTVLRTESPAAVTNATLRQCVEQCAQDTSCDAALYVTDGGADTADHGVCSHYTLMAGAREVISGGHRFSYWVKSHGGGEGGGGGAWHEDDDDDIFRGPVRTIVIVCGAIDVGCSLVFAVVVALYLRHRRQLVAAVGEIEAVEAAEPNNEAVQN